MTNLIVTVVTRASGGTQHVSFLKQTQSLKQEALRQGRTVQNGTALVKTMDIWKQRPSTSRYNFATARLQDGKPSKQEVITAKTALPKLGNILHFLLLFLNTITVQMTTFILAYSFVHFSFNMWTQSTDNSRVVPPGRGRGSIFRHWSEPYCVKEASVTLNH